MGLRYCYGCCLDMKTSSTMFSLVSSILRLLCWDLRCAFLSSLISPCFSKTSRFLSTVSTDTSSVFASWDLSDGDNFSASKMSSPFFPRQAASSFVKSVVSFMGLIIAIEWEVSH